MGCVLLGIEAKENINQIPVKSQPEILSSERNDVIHSQQSETFSNRMIQFSEIKWHCHLSRMPWPKDKTQMSRNPVHFHHFEIIK